MKESLRNSLNIARKRERQNPSNENTRRVQKIILQAMLVSNPKSAIDYKEKHNLLLKNLVKPNKLLIFEVSI